MIDIAIIGGGPAGLTAALYAARGGAKTVVFERSVLGGQITTTDHVENYPAFPEGISGAELGELMAQQAQAHGAEVVAFTDITELKIIETTNEYVNKGDDSSTAANTAFPAFKLVSEYETYTARTVIIATGAVPLRLEIPGEAEYTGRGVSWCATCDAAFYREKTVAVIGGGNAAVEEALFLTKFASKVYLVHRRNEFRAEAILVKRARAHNQIEIVTPYTPCEIQGDCSKVTGLVLELNQGVRHRGTTMNDNSCPSSIPKSRTLGLDGVFEFVGTRPQSSLAQGLLTPNSSGYLMVNDDGSTAVPGLFCAGDVTHLPLKQVVTAAGAGATAGFSALNYLEQHATAASHSLEEDYQ